MSSSSSQKYSTKQSEYRTYSSKGNIDEKDFDSMRSELLPSRYGSLVTNTNGIPAKNKEYYYEFSDEKNPERTFNRKDLHTVEQYEFTSSPGSNQNVHSGRLEIADTPHRFINTTGSLTKSDLSHNIDELDTLLDDLQKDQERKLYRGGYTSDTLESTTVDYVTKKPKSSTLSQVERDTEWLPTPTGSISKEFNRHFTRESHIIPAPTVHTSSVQSSPTPVCNNCHTQTNIQSSPSGVPMNKVITTVKTYTYEVPANVDPSTLPIPGVTTDITEKYSTSNVSENYSTTNAAQKYPAHTHTSEKVVANNRNYIEENHENRTYANTHFNTSTPVKNPPTYGGGDSTKVITKTTEYTTSGGGYPGGQGSPYPSKSPTYNVTIETNSNSEYPPSRNTGSSTYKYTTTNYSTYNSSGGKPGPFPNGAHPPVSQSPFPRNESPAPRIQEPPKRIDDLLADFPVSNIHTTTTDAGIRHRPNPARGPDGEINGHIVKKEEIKSQNASNGNEGSNFIASKNIAGPAVYYPPGHEMFAHREEAAFQQAGGGYMKAKGQYQYEAKSKSKSKTSSDVKAVPVCLPLCCAMPCTIL